MTCLIWLLLLAFGLFVVLTLIRWFEQTAEAVDQGWWDKVTLLVMFPFAVWFFPSPVSAGRPMPVPVHEPVRGFGLNRPAPPAGAPPGAPPPGPTAEKAETPPAPPTPPRRRPPVEQAQIDRLRQKMREQGMLDDEEDQSSAK